MAESGRRGDQGQRFLVGCQNLLMLPWKSRTISFMRHTNTENEQTRLFRRVCCTQSVLCHRRHNLTLIFIIRQHHGEAVSQGEVIPREVKPLAALVGPDRADARPDFLTIFVFARVPAVVEDIRWCVWHRNEVSATAFSVGDWQGMSTQGSDAIKNPNRLEKRRGAPQGKWR